MRFSLHHSTPLVPGRSVQARPRARTVEIGPQPRMLGCQHRIHVSGGDDLTLAKYGNPVTDCIQAVEIVGYHKNSHCRSSLQGQDELIEIAGADRIEPRSRLVEKKN